VRKRRRERKREKKKEKKGEVSMGAGERLTLFDSMTAPAVNISNPACLGLLIDTREVCR
jgi:hypothetical protein